MNIKENEYMKRILKIRNLIIGHEEIDNIKPNTSKITSKKYNTYQACICGEIFKHVYCMYISDIFGYMIEHNESSGMELFL